MATRRARFKPVLNQPARRGRPGATDVQSTEVAKEAVVSQEQPEKNLCTTPCQDAVNPAIRTELSSPLVIKNNESSGNQSNLTPDKPVEVKQPSSAPATPQKEAEGAVSVKESLHQSSTPIASSPKQDAAPAPPAADNLPVRLPPRRPSSPAQSSGETTSVTKGDSVAATRSPKDDKKETAPSARPRRQPSSMNQRALAARRNFMKLSKDGPPAKSALTMFDLIFYNPVTNPMSKKSSPPAKGRDRLPPVSGASTVLEQRLEEEKVDDVHDCQMEDKENKEEDKEKQEEIAVPVPRVKVGPDGRIVIDEQSLVIETTESKKHREEMDKSEVVFDTGLSKGFYKRSARSKDWSNSETLKFYRALHVYGSDFSLMQVVFKDRTRRELKLKFKKEERMRMHLVDKALRSPLDFDPTELEEEALKEEEEKAAQLAKEKEEKDNPRPKPKPMRYRKPCSLAQREMIQDSEVSSDSPPPPPKRKIVRKPKAKPTAEPQSASAPKPESEPQQSNVPTGLDVFDDVVLPTVKTTNEKATNVPAPKKRQAPPRDPNKSPKTSKKKKKADVVSTPESDHSYAASPFRSPQSNGTAAAKTPPKKARVTPAHTPIQNGIKYPEIVTIDLSNQVLLTPPPNRTAAMSPNKCFTELQTPKTPLSVNITRNAGSPYECGPVPNTAVPVQLPANAPASNGIVLQNMPTTVEPGSFYVLQTQCPDDPRRHVLGVYMVTNKKPVVPTPPSENQSLVPEAVKAPSSEPPPEFATVVDPVEGTVLTKL